MKSIAIKIMAAISILMAAPLWTNPKNFLEQVSFYMLPTSGIPTTWFHNNFYVVQEGKCYRSKTLCPHELEETIKKYGIKTILNLRENHGIWYDKETAIAQKYGVQHITIKLDARVLPTQLQLREIFTIFNDPTKYPILIKCIAGADRTGAMAAFWKLTQQDATLEQALCQQLPSMSHFEWRFPLMRKFTGIMHRLKQHYSTWDEAINHYNPDEELKNISLPPIAVRIWNSIVNTANTAIKNNPKIILASLAATVLAYAFIKK